MTAHEQMKKMLDELMGTCRDGEDLNRSKVHFASTRVCKSFLLNCCPHEILANTKGDLGKCPKYHDVALRADFENASRKYEYEFQVEALQQLKNFIGESDRRTQVSKMRLAVTQEHLNTEEAKKLTYIQQLEEQITDLLKEVEKLGALGDVEGSLKLMEEVESVKQVKFEAEEKLRMSTPASINQQKRLRVCEVCSSYLGLHDNDKRLADHFSGKLHLGFRYIREKCQELENLLQERHIKDVLDNEFKPSPEKKRHYSPEPIKHRHKHHRSHSRSRSGSHDSNHHRSHCHKRESSKKYEK